MTLVGFLRADRFNVYAGVERLTREDDAEIPSQALKPQRLVADGARERL
jgi:hypothetical protein